MIAQNSILDFITKTSTDTSGKAKTENTDKTAFPKFQDILDLTLRKPVVFDRPVKAPANNETAKSVSEKGQESAAQVKCYRDIQKSAAKDMQQAKGREASGTDGDSPRPVDDDMAGKAVKREDAVVNALAEGMGISSQELMQLLASANIRPEELADAAKAPTIAEKLSGILKLSGEQEQMLEKLIGLTLQQVGEQSGVAQGMKAQVPEAQESRISGPTESDWVQVDHPRLEVEVKNSGGMDLAAVTARCRDRMDQLLEKAKQGGNGFWEELATELAAAAGEGSEGEKAPVAVDSTGIALKDTPTAKKTEDSKPQETEGNTAAKEIADVRAGDSAENSGEEDGAAGRDDPGSSPVLQEAGQNSPEEQDVPFNGIVAGQSLKNQEAASAVKVDKATNLSKNEIINQVVEKAKVIVDGQKHEMVMELKPDSLGKLSLKVVTEHGMVVAKFIAESQQVKEVLETNMQLLKDTLEKQGMTIQGLSVSVGQDSQRQYRWSGETAGNTGGKASEPGRDGTGFSGIAGNLENQEKIRSYYWNDSKINLTA